MIRIMVILLIICIVESIAIVMLARSKSRVYPEMGKYEARLDSLIKSSEIWDEHREVLYKAIVNQEDMRRRYDSALERLSLKRNIIKQQYEKVSRFDTYDKQQLRSYVTDYQ